jgi:hypothetical protein
LSRRRLWLAVAIACALAACRDLLGVDEASLDPALEDAAAGAGGEPPGP